MSRAVWQAVTESIGKGCRYRILQGGAPLSFAAYLQLLGQDRGFASWYTGLLAGAHYPAFFWEHPAMRVDNMDAAAEFVLLDSPELARLRPSPGPFQAHFDRVRGRDIVSFPSLGGDAVLVAPLPTGPPDAYAHLATFLREAADSQIANLWRETGRLMRDKLGERNLWLSTSGLGVSWLHIRLDSRPKYYQYRPYTTGDGTSGL